MYINPHILIDERIRQAEIFMNYDLTEFANSNCWFATNERPDGQHTFDCKNCILWGTLGLCRRYEVEDAKDVIEHVFYQAKINLL